MARILHIITDLDIGGAERMLCDLVRATPGLDHRVLSLTTVGPIGSRIAALGHEVDALGMRRAPADATRLPSLVSRIRRAAPDLIHTWMIHANFVGGLAARATVRAPVVWSLHHSGLDARHAPRATIALNKLSALLSRRIPARVVSCSRAAMSQHTAAGYDVSRMVHIPNGVATDRFRPDPQARLAIRNELGIEADAELVGMVARFDPQKDFKNFIAAARLVAERRPNVHFLACGRGVPAALAGAGDRIHLLDERDDIERVFAAIDVACLSSAYGEGAPVALLEALACGVPCVATDLGDTREIIGEFGVVVAPKDPAALADALVDVLDRRKTLSEGARERVTARLSIDHIADAYTGLYEDVLG